MVHRTRLLVLILLTLGFLTIISGLAIWRANAKMVPVREIAVMFPGTEDRNWRDLLTGIRLAAREVGGQLQIDEASRSADLIVDQETLRFKWYPEIGARAMTRRLSQLVESHQPPVAVIGATNSHMARSMAVTLANATSKTPPYFFLTTASADDLVRIYPDRTYRFGGNNSTQARTVCARLKEFLKQKEAYSGKLRAAVIKASDDHFSVDAALHFAAELRQNLSAEIVRDRHHDQDIWSLSTSAGPNNLPSKEERQLAERLVAEMTQQSDGIWAIALPVGSDSIRRIALALVESFNAMPDQGKAEMLKKNVLFVVADTLDVTEFENPYTLHFSPEDFVFPTAFYVHAHPYDRSIDESRIRSTSIRYLNREIGRACVYLLKHKARVEDWGQLLTEWTEEGKGKLQQGELVGAGGAAMVEPRGDSFNLSLPAAWSKAP